MISRRSRADAGIAPGPEGARHPALLLTLKLAVAIAGAVLALQAIRFAAAEQLVRQGMFEEALDWRADDVAALTQSAQVEFGSHDNAGAVELATRAVQGAPLDVAAIRSAGLAVQAAGNDDGAEAIMRQAAQIGWRDAPTQLWLLQAAASRSDWTTAAQRADALARTNVARDIVLPALWGMAAQPAAARAIAPLLAAQPAWRDTFFRAAGGRANASEAGLQNLSAALAHTGAPVTAEERSLYVRALVNEGQAARARTIWLTGLPVSARNASALINDPDFTRLGRSVVGVEPTPFDWKLRTTGKSSATVERSDGGTQVEAVLSGGHAAPLLSQTLALPPGSYSLVLVAPATSSTLLRWRLSCLDAPTVLLRDAPIDPSSIASVPAGCPAQQLQLVPGDMPGSIAIHGVRLERR